MMKNLQRSLCGLCQKWRFSNNDIEVRTGMDTSYGKIAGIMNGSSIYRMKFNVYLIFGFIWLKKIMDWKQLV